jgi:uncharacterized protein YndB with AHSA1/START domain
MTTRSTALATFVIERRYDSPPDQVYAAWSTPSAKARWFAPGDGGSDYRLDFQVGGHELNRGRAPDGDLYTYEATYSDIVADRRIVYTYTMDRGDIRISVSLATVEFEATGSGTRLTLSEQGVFLDEGDKVEFREEGTRALLDGLASALGSTSR